MGGVAASAPGIHSSPGGGKVLRRKHNVSVFSWLTFAPPSLYIFSPFLLGFVAFYQIHHFVLFKNLCNDFFSSLYFPSQPNNLQSDSRDSQDSTSSDSFGGDGSISEWLNDHHTASSSSNHSIPATSGHPSSSAHGNGGAVVNALHSNTAANGGADLGKGSPRLDNIDLSASFHSNHGAHSAHESDEGRVIHHPGSNSNSPGSSVVMKSGVNNNTTVRKRATIV